MNRIHYCYRIMRCLGFFMLLVTTDALAEPIQEGGLYREASKPEVYVIHGQKKVWIPTADALVVMGYNWGQVQVVPDGTLQAFQRFDIRSSSLTPGSVVFPPAGGDSHHPLHVDGIPNAMTIISQGKHVQLAELRGWVRAKDTINPDICNEENDGADYHYALELDTDWALSHGIDLHKLLRVGNFVHESISQQGNPRAMVSIPVIKVELNSWGWSSRYPPGASKPQDWTHRQKSCKPVDWPFNPTQPDKPKPSTITKGAYVKMIGSLVVDSAHFQPPNEGQQLLTDWCRFAGFCSGPDGIVFNKVWQGSVHDWEPGVNPESPTHPARWTEMHPPDEIQTIDNPVDQPKRLVTVRGVALVARQGVLNTCEKQEFDIVPDVSEKFPRPPNGVVKYQELRSSYPEIYFPWGENSDNGSWITVFNDHIHVRAQVCGGLPFGSPGRFKALYRVWWEEGPSTGTGTGEEQPRKCHRTEKCCPNETVCEDCVPHGQACRPAH